MAPSLLLGLIDAEHLFFLAGKDGGWETAKLPHQPRKRLMFVLSTTSRITRLAHISHFYTLLAVMEVEK
jgi:hypothetical protein